MRSDMRVGACLISPSCSSVVRTGTAHVMDAGEACRVCTVVPRRSRRKRVVENGDELCDGATPVFKLGCASERKVSCTDGRQQIRRALLGEFAAGVTGGREDGSWRSLGVENAEMCLALTLPTGQSFRWKKTGPSQFTGVVGAHLISLRQTADDVLFLLHSSEASVSEVEGELRSYFNLNVSLVELWAQFAAADARFAAVAPYVAGARLLRQAPVECVFQFICSSNNHLQRIALMVDHLASHGPYLGSVNGVRFHAFPCLDQLASISESQLRKAGFGYRAKYIVGAVEVLQQKEGGGESWLCSLRQQPLDDTVTALCSLPGIGPKVAACVALFSLDQHHAIPVDTHVWQIALRYLMPELRGRTLTPKLHRDVSEAFVKRFGSYAGWAHTVLFIAELSSQQALLPAHLRCQTSQKKVRSKASSQQLQPGQVAIEKYS